MCNTGGAFHWVEVPGKVFTARFGTLLLTQKRKAREKKNQEQHPNPFLLMVSSVTVASVLALMATQVVWQVVAVIGHRQFDSLACFVTRSSS